MVRNHPYRSHDRHRRPDHTPRGGVVNSSPVQEAYTASTEATLLDLLMERSGRSRTSTKRLIASGRVSVAEVPTTRATERIPAGTAVTVHRLASVPPFSHPQITVEWEDEAYVVVYKESGIATVNTAHRDPRQTVMHILSRHYKRSDPTAKLFMLTRLDKSSAGYVLFAKSIEAKERLARRWAIAVQHQRFALVVEGELPSREPFTLTAVSTPVDEERRGRKKDSGGRATDHPGKSGRKTPITVEAEVKPLRSSPGGELHLLEADVRGARIFSLRKLFGDNRLRIFGDIRYHSHFYAQERIALAQTELAITLPHTGETLSLRRPIPSTLSRLLARKRESSCRMRPDSPEPTTTT